jgi:HAMP domain-containing protein
MTLRLHSRLVVWNLVVIGLISTILGYFLNHTLREHMQREIREYMRAESRVAAANFAAGDPAISPDDRADELGQLLASQVTLFDLEGHIAGDSDLEGTDLKNAGGRTVPEVQQALLAGFGYDVRWNPDRLVDYSYVAIRLDSYVLRLARPLSALDSLMSNVWTQLTIAFSIATGLTLVFGYLARAMISRPLREISATSKKLAEGDLKQRLPVTGDGVLN